MLTEYDEEAVLKMIGEEKYEDGYAAGIEQGIEQGIKQLISKKYKKNMDSSTIAEQLELEEDYVKQVVELLENEEKI